MYCVICIQYMYNSDDVEALKLTGSMCVCIFQTVLLQSMVAVPVYRQLILHLTEALIATDISRNHLLVSCSRLETLLAWCNKQFLWIRQNCSVLRYQLYVERSLPSSVIPRPGLSCPSDSRLPGPVPHHCQRV